MSEFKVLHPGKSYPVYFDLPQVAERFEIDKSKDLLPLSQSWYDTYTSEDGRHYLDTVAEEILDPVVEGIASTQKFPEHTGLLALPIAFTDEGWIIDQDVLQNIKSLTHDNSLSIGDIGYTANASVDEGDWGQVIDPGQTLYRYRDDLVIQDDSNLGSNKFYWVVGVDEDSTPENLEQIFDRFEEKYTYPHDLALSEVGMDVGLIPVGGVMADLLDR